MTVRELELADYGRGYLTLLEQLTTVGDVTFADFQRTFSNIQQSKLHTVLVATDGDQLLGSATLVIEPKFIHGCSPVGHIEDVVVAKEARGTGVGALLVDHLVEAALLAGCYKVLLDCSEKHVGFYEKSHFARDGVCMAVRRRARL
jgi:glucosamine-phosphate N-acetyltransferase